VNDPENAERFLEIIAHQADRLNAIIEDLLALSRVERDVEGAGIEMDRCALRALLDVVVQHFDPRSQEKGIRITLNCPPDVNIKANQQLLEQAIGNLLDNAIKYSIKGTLIKVETLLKDGQACISVTDEGCGIAAPHLPRLFERFYRVDSARSREVGGTGLGLSSRLSSISLRPMAVASRSRVNRAREAPLPFFSPCSMASIVPEMMNRHPLLFLTLA
jgi:two-component system phosphate regulon sensor histidine kinase PhoR